MSRRWISCRRRRRAAPRRTRSRRQQRRNQRPVFARNETLDLKLAVADEPQRHRLDPARRSRARQFAPQHRREREADEVIERAAGEIRIDQGMVDVARPLHRIGHRLLGDGIEHHPLDALVRNRTPLLEGFEHMPGDRFAFAVRVGRQNELVGAPDGVGDILQPLLRLRIDFPNHLEIVIGIDRSVLGRQVTDVPEGGQNFITPAQIGIDRLCLCGRFPTTTIFMNSLIVFRFIQRPQAGGANRRRRRKWVKGASLSNCPADRDVPARLFILCTTARCLTISLQLC